MRLLRTEDFRAYVIWAAILNTRARLQLLQNLADMCLASKRKKKTLGQICEDFRALSKIRNFLAHSSAFYDQYECCEYLRFTSPEKMKPGHKDYLEYRVIDRAFINELAQANRKIVSLSERVSRFEKGIRLQVKALRIEPPQRHLGRMIAKSLRLDLGKPPKPKRLGQSSRASQQKVS
ncbi:hypothetical protein AYO42_05545 [Rhizomicrobium sp. SCGC AG-212-E05]|nr:hypothetical protein AYO42_05545 [Rhizomicrobium sp. SCGC AG-212-E05]